MPTWLQRFRSMGRRPSGDGPSAILEGKVVPTLLGLSVPMIMAMVLRVRRLTKRPDFLGFIGYSSGLPSGWQNLCKGIRAFHRVNADILPFYSPGVTIQ